MALRTSKRGRGGAWGGTKVTALNGCFRSGQHLKGRRSVVVKMVGGSRWYTLSTLLGLYDAMSESGLGDLVGTAVSVYICFSLWWRRLRWK